MIVFGCCDRLQNQSRALEVVYFAEFQFGIVADESCKTENADVKWHVTFDHVTVFT